MFVSFAREVETTIYNIYRYIFCTSLDDVVC